MNPMDEHLHALREVYDPQPESEPDEDSLALFVGLRNATLITATAAALVLVGYEVWRVFA